MDVKKLKQSLENEEKLTIIDVRNQNELLNGIITGSKHIPLKDLIAKTVTGGLEIGKSEKIVVYCAVGGRSRVAVLTLRASGYSNVHNLDGGIDAWKSILSKKV
jgi:sulfur-carrier protein adenylyltransferase/sulfurtransferase